MNSYQIGILCMDTGYAEGLSFALERETGGLLQCSVLRQPEEQEEGLRLLKPLDLLLTEWPERTGESKAMAVAALCRRRGDSGIYMYQSVRGIAGEILEAVQVRAVSSRPSGSIAVFSPLGRCGKTTLARAIAGACPGERGIYIGMEDAGTEAVHSELPYLIRQHAPELMEAVSGETKQEAGISCIYLSGMYPEIRDVTMPDLAWFSRQLLGPGQYETVVFDFGCGALASPEELSYFDRIYLPVLSEPRAVRKIEIFRLMLIEAGRAELWQKILPVEIPEELCLPGEDGMRVREILSILPG